LVMLILVYMESCYILVLTVPAWIAEFCSSECVNLSSGFMKRKNFLISWANTTFSINNILCNVRELLS
jgi:hypothetical protein